MWWLVVAFLHLFSSLAVLFCFLLYQSMLLCIQSKAAPISRARFCGFWNLLCSRYSCCFLLHLAVVPFLVGLVVDIVVLIIIVVVCCRLLSSVNSLVFVAVVVVLVVLVAAAVIVVVFSCCCYFLLVDNEKPEVPMMHVIQSHFGGLLLVILGFSLVQNLHDFHWHVLFWAIHYVTTNNYILVGLILAIFIP